MQGAGERERGKKGRESEVRWLWKGQGRRKGRGRRGQMDGRAGLLRLEFVFEFSASHIGFRGFRVSGFCISVLVVGFQG